MTLYTIKPRFQMLLRPLVKLMAGAGITANQVTVSALMLSMLIGTGIAIFSEYHYLFLLIPAWMLVRMGLNAIDGMLAREFGQKTHLGAMLNETSDVLSDAFLYLPFALVAPFSTGSISIIIVLALLTEFVGVLGLTIGASRRYDGPMGKSDRALVFAFLGLWIGFTGTLPAWVMWSVPVVAGLLIITIFNRARYALYESGINIHQGVNNEQ